MINKTSKPGRPPGSKNKKPPRKVVAFTPRVKAETLDWINSQPMSQGRVIDFLVDDARKENK